MMLKNTSAPESGALVHMGVAVQQDYPDHDMADVPQPP